MSKSQVNQNKKSNLNDLEENKKNKVNLFANLLDGNNKIASSDFLLDINSETELESLDNENIESFHTDFSKQLESIVDDPKLEIAKQKTEEAVRISKSIRHFFENKYLYYKYNLEKIDKLIEEINSYGDSNSEDVLDDSIWN